MKKIEKINQINKELVIETITKNCISKKQDIDLAIKARLNAISVAENENSTENEIAEANALAKKFELRLNYNYTGIITVIENGTRDAFATKKSCTEVQRNLGKAYATATEAVKNALYLDKQATVASMACCENNEAEAEEKAEKAAIAAAAAYEALNDEEKQVFNSIVAAKTAAQTTWATAKTNFANKVGLDLGESVKGFVEASILKIDAKTTNIGTRVPVKYKKVNGRIRDIRLANER